MRIVIRSTPRAFTLIELLIVVGIIAILAAIAVPNFLLAQERAMRAADAANMHAIATALQAYYVDFNTLPPADAIAGPFESSGLNGAAIKNGPAGGGSWDGLPWSLLTLGYLNDSKTLFCPKYLKLYPAGKTVKGDYPRYHNFRYAYNSASLAHGGNATSGIMTGTTWILRDLWIDARSGFYASYYPDYPADYRYPWEDGKLEHVMDADFAVKLVQGGTDLPPED